MTVEKVNMTSPAAFQQRMHLQQMLYHFQQYVVPTSSFAFSFLEFHTLNFESVIRIQHYNKSRFKRIQLLKVSNENFVSMCFRQLQLHKEEAKQSQ